MSTLRRARRKQLDHSHRGSRIPTGTFDLREDTASPAVAAAFTNGNPRSCADRLNGIGNAKLHLDVRNAGFHEFGAERQEAGFAIEPFRVRLRVQEYALQTDLDGVIDGGLEQLPTDVAAALFFEHRHPTDLARAREQARRAQREPHFVQRKEMSCFFVEPVPLQVQRYVLFFDEYSLPNGAQLLHVRRPLDSDGVHRHQSIRFANCCGQTDVLIRRKSRERCPRFGG